MTEKDAFNQAFASHPVGVLIGIALIILVLFLGWALLINGWPRFKK